jgi:hypothetical protein
MDGHTLRSRLLELMQRSRKAMRLYASVRQSQALDADGGELHELQAEQWRSVNEMLLRQLGMILDQPNSKQLISLLCSLQQSLQIEVRDGEQELRVKQRALVDAVQASDFVKCALVAKQLVACKARQQAENAACNELHEITKRLGSSALSSGAEVAEAQRAYAAAPELNEHHVAASPTPVTPRPLAKVVQFRRFGTK